MTADEILEAARQMSRDDQRWLVEMLLRPKGSLTRAEIDEAWAVELERRAAIAKLEDQIVGSSSPDQSPTESALPAAAESSAT